MSAENPQRFKFGPGPFGIASMHTAYPQEPEPTKPKEKTQINQVQTAVNIARVFNPGGAPDILLELSTREKK